MRYETDELIVDLDYRTDITEIYAPCATQVDCAECTSLVTLSAPHAEWVDCRGCAALVRLSAPHAKWVNCGRCAALATLDIPNATYVDCEDCVSLTSLDAPRATYVNCAGCTSLTRINDYEVASGEEAEARIREVARHALQPGALRMRRWHSCDTAHCAGGWGITLAGEKGKALEAELGSLAAATILLGTEALSHFFDTDEEARKWLAKKLNDPLA